MKLGPDSTFITQLGGGSLEEDVEARLKSRHVAPLLSQKQNPKDRTSIPATK
jgi:hypothetical protein